MVHLSAVHRCLARGAYLGIFVCLVFSHVENAIGQVSGSQVDLPYRLIPDAQQPQAKENSKPWVFWYWMHASISKEGITADLEAMKAAGIGGAYLMSIKGAANPPFMKPPIDQLTPEWWEMIRHAFREADRLGVKIGMHASDGFAVAGGPWITPENSMQRVVWEEVSFEGDRRIKVVLPKPEAVQGFYRDIVVLAFPTVLGGTQSTQQITPLITTNKTGVDASLLVQKDNKENFRSEDPCWIQYAFEKPFTCRSIIIRTTGPNYQAHRLMLEVSDDGKAYRSIGRLQPPRHGWQDNDADVTHAIVPTTARFFRFKFDPSGSEPGSEDLDAAKWKATLKISSLELSSAPKIHQYEGKTGKVWRVSTRTTTDQVPADLCIPANSIIDITRFMDADGTLTWDAPRGNWTILRIGHTSTGHTNYTGGAGKGLECDKFNSEAAKIQFENWFGKAVDYAGPELASRVLNTFHVDSWECGSQNWSTVFREEFKKRRGYDLLSYLPTFAGYPVQSADFSERFLYDIRQTITELVHDHFYATLKALAHKKGCSFSAESVAPTMTGDGMLHYAVVDIPMGEFWFRSPTHDKPNDMLDAISGAHIYGKPLIQAEAFTQLRMAWDEHPAVLKTLGDLNYALGANRFTYHVFTHNPWVDRKPGMTLDGVGLYFQRDQTWWKPGRAWTSYAQRCQALLQQGVPIVDLAVFTGEEIPRRAILPDRLVSTIPGLFGDAILTREKERLSNLGEPLRDLPEGVKHSANMTGAVDWIDALNGYRYDSFNKDALLRLASVKNGKITLPGGASYSVLILPGAHAMSPQANYISVEVISKLWELVQDGATIVFTEIPNHTPGLTGFPESDRQIKEISKKLFQGTFTRTKDGVEIKYVGKGRVVKGPYNASSFDILGIQRDVTISEVDAAKAEGFAWTHRRSGDRDIYFLSNQLNRQRDVVISIRGSGKRPSCYDAVSNKAWEPRAWAEVKERTTIDVSLPANGSMFIILQPSKSNDLLLEKQQAVGPEEGVTELSGAWTVTFDPSLGGPVKPVLFSTLSSWSDHADPSIRYYSGTAAYSKSFRWNGVPNSKVWLDVGRVENLAEIIVNNISCGIAWTAPYQVEISKALKDGENNIRIEVTNTWANRLIGDHTLPEEKRITKTTAPYRLEGKSLFPAGLLGPVKITREKIAGAKTKKEKSVSPQVNDQ